MAINKSVGKIAEKMINITQKAVKKLEEYGAQSASENQNENAKKLEIAMNKLSKTIEINKSEYIKKVEENAEELENSVKKFCKDIKERVEVAKQKATEDIKQKQDENNQNNENK